jgi:hypothetical protein
MVRKKHVALAFVAAMAVFTVTHVLDFPGSIHRLMQVTGGIKILDMQPSFSSDETHARLAAMGDMGREMYLRSVLTVDAVFPVAVFVFLFLWAKLVAQRLGGPMGAALRFFAPAYLVLDFVENMLIFALLKSFPDRLELVGSLIGYLTVAKRGSMIAAFVLPAVGLIVAWRLGKRAPTAA